MNESSKKLGSQKQSLSVYICLNIRIKNELLGVNSAEGGCSGGYTKWDQKVKNSLHSVVDPW